MPDLRANVGNTPQFFGSPHFTPTPNHASEVSGIGSEGSVSSSQVSASFSFSRHISSPSPFFIICIGALPLTMLPHNSAVVPAGAAEGTNVVRVSATDNGNPMLSGSQTFRVIVGGSRWEVTITAPSGDGQVHLGFAVQVGHHYRVDFKDQLEAAWAPLPGNESLLATTGTLTVNDTVTGRSQRFYRVVQLD